MAAVVQATKGQHVLSIVVVITQDHQVDHPAQVVLHRVAVQAAQAVVAAEAVAAVADKMPKYKYFTHKIPWVNLPF